MHFVYTCVEVLAQLIRECKDIKGIRLGNQEIKISLFADDATCVLKDTDSLRYLFSITDIFCEYSGLKLNIEKCYLIYLGPWKTKKEAPYNVQVTYDSINILGITNGHNKAQCYSVNFDLKIEKMTTRLNMWSARSLSLPGKVLIAKSAGMSNLIYSISCMPVNKRL